VVSLRKDAGMKGESMAIAAMRADARGAARRWQARQAAPESVRWAACPRILSAQVSGQKPASGPVPGSPVPGSSAAPVSIRLPG